MVRKGEMSSVLTAAPAIVFIGRTRGTTRYRSGHCETSVTGLRRMGWRAR